jgi:hypothetical protein
MCRQKAQPLICDTRVFTSSTSECSTSPERMWSSSASIGCSALGAISQ